MPTSSIQELATRSRLGAHPSPLHGLRRPTPLLGSARTVRQWVRQWRELRMLEAVYPSVSRSLGLDKEWRVHRVLPTVGDVTVGLVGGPAPVAVLKYARSHRGTAALEASGSAIETLAADARLGEWAHLLPRRLTSTHSPDGHLVVLEQLKPGTDSRALIAQDNQDTVVESVLEPVAAIHDRTSVPITIGQDVLHRWVDEPIDLLAAWYGNDGGSRRLGLQRLRRALHHGLEGREVNVGWIHGDLAPGNVLLELGPEQDPTEDRPHDRLKVSALLDWERANAEGLPDVDVLHFHLATRMLTEKRELGALVVDLLETFDEAGDEASDKTLSDPVLVLITWLHHVSGIVAKSGKAHPRGMWAARNVDPVLSYAASWEQWDRRAEPAGPPARIRRATATWLPWAAMAVAVLLWAVALPRVDTRNMNDLGLVPKLPWQWFTAMAVMAGGFALALGRRSSKGLLPVAYPLVLAALFYLTPPILYGTPRYFWAWKHAGIVDFILRNGAVDPHIDVLPVYHNWPGFFAFNAMLTDLLGLRTPLSYVAWTETFFNLLTIAAVMALLHGLTRDIRTVALGGWLFAIGNWVGQGYWSPQALAFVWYLVVVTVLLRWFPALRDRPKRGFAAVQRVGLMAVVLLLLACVVSTHQLTPLAMVLTTAALVLVRRTDAVALPLLSAVMLAAWLLYAAAPFTSSNLAGILGAVGAVDRNVHGTLIGYGQVSAGLVVVSLMARALTLAIGTLAGLGFLKEMRAGHTNIAAVVLAGAPVAIVAFSPYGSEILFRSYLFALPGLVYFAAVLLWPAGVAGTWTRCLVVVLVSIGLMLGFVFAQFGNDRRFHFTDAEIAAAKYVYGEAPPNSLLIEGSRNYPAQFENYDNFTYVTMDLEEPPTRTALTRQPVEVLSSWMQDPRYGAAYLIITRSQKAETNSTGGLPGRGLPGVERALSNSPVFRAVYRNRDAVVFVLSRRTAGPSPVSSPGGSR